MSCSFAPVRRNRTAQNCLFPILQRRHRREDSRDDGTTTTAQRAQIWPADRAAYTLMEMLISSVLIAALMSVIWGMLSMYNGYLTAGRQQSVERQLIRSVFSSLESDVRQVAVADTNPRVQLLTESLDAATESTAGDFMGDASAALNPERDQAAR